MGLQNLLEVLLLISNKTRRGSYSDSCAGAFNPYAIFSCNLLQEAFLDFSISPQANVCISLAALTTLAYQDLLLSWGLKLLQDCADQPSSPQGIDKAGPEEEPTSRGFTEQMNNDGIMSSTYGPYQLSPS